MKLLKKFLLGMLLGAAVVAQPALAQKYVCMQSTQGEWCMRMLPEAAAGTVSNFLAYVNSGRYTNNLVHRSVPGFVIQGGGFDVDAQGLLGVVPSFGAITNEFRRSNLRGTVAMAKSSGDINSATSQWFINLADNTSLDLPENGSFTVFAEVVYGMAVVDKIATLRVGNLINIWGEAFTEVPIDLPASATTVARKDLVLINRAYTTDLLPGSTLLPYHCTPDVASAAVAEFCTSSITLPVTIQGIAYEATLDLVAAQPMTFALRAGSLKTLSALPATYASYNATAKELTIPTVRVGSTLVDNVVLKFAGAPSQQFTLSSFSKR